MVSWWLTGAAVQCQQKPDKGASFYVITHPLFRGVATGQVFRYLPDHFFSKLPEWLPIQNGWSLLPLLANWITFDINCAWIFRSYYDRDWHASRPQFYLQDESKTFSEGLKIQNFPGEACPLCMRALLVPRPLEITWSPKISWLRSCYYSCRPFHLRTLETQWLNCTSQ